MKPSKRQTTIAKFVLAWAIYTLAFSMFAMFASGMDDTPRTTNDIVANVIKIVLDIGQLVVAIILVRHYRLWIYRLAIALIPITIMVFWLLPLGWWS